MKNLLPVFIAVLLLCGMLPGQGQLSIGHYDHGLTATHDQNHKHVNSMPDLHCSVSSSCAPVFNAPGDVATRETLLGRIKWNIDQAPILSGHAPQKDPPVPRA